MNARLRLVNKLAVVMLIASILLSGFPLQMDVAHASTAEYGGFLYPFKDDPSDPNDNKRLSQNAHDGYDLDFMTVANPGQEFDVLAPKDGVVVKFEDRFPVTQGVEGCPSNNEDFPNYILLGHGSRGDNQYETYTLYYHFVQGSISGSGISRGMFVRLGQKIGRAGQTGHSDGSTPINHLHMAMSKTMPAESSHRPLNCNGVTLTDTYYYVIEGENGPPSIPIGFEEKGNQWPLLGGGTGPLNDPVSFNWTGIQQYECNPISASTKVVLYNHVDYGGECVTVSSPDLGSDVPLGMHISSIYLNPTWLILNPQYFHTLTLWDEYNETGNSIVISNSNPKLGDIGWNDRTRSIHNALHNNAQWLLEESYAGHGPLEVDIHIRVSNDPDFNAWRVCFDGQNCQENAAPINELYYTWNTFGWTDGNHTISIQYRRTSDNYDWNNADYYEVSYYLSPNRAGIAPCDGGDGAELASGSDCIRLTQSFEFLDHIGWGDRSNLQVTVNGPFEALIYDGAHFEGPALLVQSGETQYVGGNVSSVLLRNPSGVPPVPSSPFWADSSTTYLLHFDEGSGNQVSSSVGSLVGSFNGAASWVSGKFGQAVFAPNPPDGSGVGFGSLDLQSSFTVEAWVKFNSIGGDQRIMAQLGGGSNTGYNKWLLGTVGNHFRAWACHTYGCHEGYSFIEPVVGEWYFLMFTYDGEKTAKLYVNNNLQSTINMDFSMSPGATTLQMGHGEGIYGCNCTIDEVRISDNVRVPEWWAAHSLGFSDNFNSNVINTWWTWIDPAGDSNYSLSDNPGHLRLYSPTGKPGYLLLNPRLIQSINGGFSITTKVTIHPIANYQGAGLLVWKDEYNYIQIHRTLVKGIDVWQRIDGTYPPGVEIPFTEDTAYLRITRDGSDFSAFFSTNGTTWIEAAKLQHYMPDEIKVGIILVNEWQDNPIFADFDFFDVDKNSNEGSLILNVNQIVELNSIWEESVNISDDANSIFFTVNWPGSQVDTTLITPSGVEINSSTIDPNIFYANGPTYELYRIDNPEPGDWIVRMFGTDLSPDGEIVNLQVSEINIYNIFVPFIRR